MACENYRQYDSRWASKRYAGDTMAGSGCGPTAVANIVHQLPTTVADYIESIGGTVPGSGTIWSCIDTALDHYGYNGQQLNGGSLYGTRGSSAEQRWKLKVANFRFSIGRWQIRYMLHRTLTGLLIAM